MNELSTNINGYLQLLANVGVNVEDDHLLAILNQCKDDKRLEAAVQFIVDDAAEIHYAYPTDHAAYMIYMLAINHD